MDSSSSSSPLKVYFIPFLEPSHMMPLFDVSRLFIERGCHVTILTTPANVRSLESLISPHPNLRFHSVLFPSREIGLPEGVENLFNTTDHETVLKFAKSFPILQQRMEQFMESDPPDCIISDAFLYWSTDFANRLNIPRIVFNGYCVFVECVTEAVRGPDSPHLKAKSETDPFIIPGLPHPITMSLCQLPDYVKVPDHMARLTDLIKEVETKSYGRLANTFVEFEQEYKEHYEKMTGNKVFYLGPSHLINKVKHEKLNRGAIKRKVSEQECLSWLNSQPAKSVVYICFGSRCFCQEKQLYEIAAGLEASNHSFIWVVFRKDVDEKDEKDEEKWLPAGFRERVIEGEKRGMIIKGWAPQLLILEHQAIGAFMSHCGFNSVMEAISVSVPMITWPSTAEQFYNEALVTQVHKFGVEVGAQEWIPTAGHERKKLVGREKIEKAVKKVMDGGDEAEQWRTKAKELGKIAKAAMEENGSSQKNLTSLIEDLVRIKSEKKATAAGQ